MTVPELLHHNFDEIFIELDPVKRESMMRDAYTEDCVGIHPGGRLVGSAAINKAASEIRKSIPEYRYAVIGDIKTMHNVGMCRWGSGLPGQPYRYTGTDVLAGNVTGELLCSIPSSIVELRRSQMVE